MENPPDTEKNEALVYNEKLDDTLKDYIAVLAQRYPFSVDLKINGTPIISQLAEFWLKDSEWTAQAYALWERIESVVHSVAATNETRDAMLHLSAAASSLKPENVPESNGPTALATFDGVQGVLRQCLVPAGTQSLPSLDALAIPSGLLLICQPLSSAAATESNADDPRGSGLGAGTNIYAERARDKLPPESNINAETETVVTPPPPPPAPPSPEVA